MSYLIPWDTDSTSFNGVTRIRSSTLNFLANADFENWNNGTSVAPPGWTTTGGVTVSQQSALSIGSFCAQLVFDTSNTGEFYQTIPSSTAVDYTFTCYVKLISGTGTASLVAREDTTPFTVFASCPLNSSGSIGLAALTVKPSAGVGLRFSIEATNTTASTWQVDECMLQESKSVATTFVRSYIDDSTSQSIFGTKLFSLQRTFNQGFKLYDSTNTFDVTLAPAAASGNVTLTLPASTDTIPGIATTSTLTNKRVTPRTGTTTSSATPSINSDNVDYYSITALTTAITGVTVTGTPTDGQKLWISITGTAARAITWGTNFEASTVALPTTTVSTNRLDCGFVWNTVSSKWRIVGTA